MSSHHTPVVAAIVLAAGASRRFGATNKLLVELDGVPLVARVVAAIEAGGISRVVIVTGHEAERVAAATAGPGRRQVFNARHAGGMGTSVAAGVAALDDDVAGVLVAQADMPSIDASLVAELCRHFQAGGCGSVVYPVLADGRQGNPVIWPRRLFAELEALVGDQGGKRLIAAEGDRAIHVPVSGEGASIDIDTPAELDAYRASRSSEPS